MGYHALQCAIGAGAKVIEYVGEVIRSVLCDKRAREYDAKVYMCMCARASVLRVWLCACWYIGFSHARTQTHSLCASHLFLLPR